MNDRNIWPSDKREIAAAKLASHPLGIMLATDGWQFERFERNGDMAPIPYLRATKDNGTVEAPLVSWDWVQFQEIESAA